jgi:secreted trypsin-like serine protease
VTIRCSAVRNIPSLDSLICTTSSNPVPGFTCRGDSGGFVGGLVNNKPVVVGITSNGPTSCRQFTRFTRVAFYARWIRAACGNCQ